MYSVHISSSSAHHECTLERHLRATTFICWDVVMEGSMCCVAGTGKTLLARAVANRTDACFIRVIGSELVQKYVGEGARMVRELFQVRASATCGTQKVCRALSVILLTFSKYLELRC